MPASPAPRSPGVADLGFARLDLDRELSRAVLREAAPGHDDEAGPDLFPRRRFHSDSLRADSRRGQGQAFSVAICAL